MIARPNGNAAEPGNRRLARYVPAGIAVIILAFGVVATGHPVLHFQSAGSTTVTAQPDSPAQPPLWTPEDINKGPLVLKGRAVPNCSIEFTFDGLISGLVVANDSGEFEWEINGLTLDDYKISAKVTNAKGAYNISSEGAGSKRWIRVTNKEPLVISGVADPNSSVEITIVGTASGFVNADDKGQFSWTINNARTIDSRISAKAKDTNGNYSPPSEELTVNYLAVVRRLSAFVSLKSLQLNCDIVLPKDHPWARDLITGETVGHNDDVKQASFAVFFDEVFSNATVNRFDLKNLFLGVTPQISSDEDTITVHASSNPNNQIPLPSLHGSLMFDLPQEFPSNDGVLINVKDYEFTILDPLPSRLNGQGEATWNGNQSRPIVAYLRFRPLHRPGNFINFIRFDVSTVPYPFVVVPEFLYSLLIIIPILWAIWILRAYKSLENYDDLFRRATLYSVALCFITPIIDLALAGAFLADATTSKRILAEFEYPFSCAVVILLLWLPNKIWARRLSKTRTSDPSTSKIQFFASLLLNRLLVSAGLVFAIIGLLWIGLFKLPSNIREMPKDWRWYQLCPAIIGCVVAFPLLAWPIWLCLKRLMASPKDMSPKALSRLTQVKRFILILSCLILAVILAFVFYALAGSTGKSFWFYNFDPKLEDLFDFSLSKLSYAFQFLQEVPLYILFLGILVVLKTIDGPNPELDKATPDINRSVLLSFEKLLFVSFVVGIVWQLYLLPVSFLLAFLAYRYTMAPADKHDQLDRLTDQVFHRRSTQTSEPLNQIESLNQLESHQDSLNSLKKKFEDGLISLARFEKQEPLLSAAIDKRKTTNQIELIKENQSAKFNVRDLILAFGPDKSNWENGKHAARYSLWLAIPFALVYGGIAFLKGVGVPKTFAFLLIATHTIESFADWLILAFFFGYFFKYINGKSGLKKGLTLAVAYTLCILPLVIRDFSSSILAMLIYLTPNFIFLPFLGVLAFDSLNFRKIMGEGYSWKKQVQFEDNQTLLAFTTVPFTTAAVAVLTFFTGQYSKIIPMLLKVILPAASTAGRH